MTNSFSFCVSDMSLFCLVFEIHVWGKNPKLTVFFLSTLKMVLHCLLICIFLMRSLLTFWSIIHLNSSQQDCGMRISAQNVWPTKLLKYVPEADHWANFQVSYTRRPHPSAHLAYLLTASTQTICASVPFRTPGDLLVAVDSWRRHAAAWLVSLVTVAGAAQEGVW